jgi:hypothetical protein
VDGLRLMRWSGSYLEEKGVPGRAAGRGAPPVRHVLGWAASTSTSTSIDRWRPRELARFKPLLLGTRRAQAAPVHSGPGRLPGARAGGGPAGPDPAPRDRGARRSRARSVREWGRADLDPRRGHGKRRDRPLPGTTRARSHGWSRRTSRGRRSRWPGRTRSARAPSTDRVEFRLGSLFEPVREGRALRRDRLESPLRGGGGVEGLEPEVRDWEPRDGPGRGTRDWRWRGSPELDAGWGASRAGGLLALEVGSEPGGGRGGGRSRRQPGSSVPDPPDLQAGKDGAGPAGAV